MNFAQRKQESILKQLFDRECFVQPPTTQIHTARNFYKAITPNTEVQLQDEDDDLEVCAFSLCGKYLVCRGKKGQSIEIFRSDSLQSKFLNGQNSNLKLTDAFEHLGSLALDLEEILNKDTLFFVEGTELAIICTHGQLYEEEDDEYQGLLFATCAVSTISMEAPVQLLDTYRHHEDNFFCFDQCISLFERQLLIHSQRHNNIILLRISAEGNFEVLKKIGINTPTPQQQQLLQQFRGNDQENNITVNVCQNLIAGFKQKLLTYLYLKALNSKSEDWSHKIFCNNFERLQLIQIKCCHLLGKDSAIIVVRLGVDYTLAVEDLGSICTVVYDLAQDSVQCAFLEGDDLEQQFAGEAKCLLASTQEQHSLQLISAIHNYVVNYEGSKRLRVTPECQFRGHLLSSPYLDRCLFSCSFEGELWKWKYIQNDELGEMVRFYSNSPKILFCFGGYTDLQNIEQEWLAEGVWIRRVFHPILPLVLTLIFVSGANLETQRYQTIELKILAYHK